MAKPKAVVVGRHLYGFGGGAEATLAIAVGLVQLGYDVAMHGMVPISPENLTRLGQAGISYQYYYKGCSKHADLLINVDHFEYEAPLAKKNLMHVFHPHDKNRPSDEFLGKYRLSGNSAYTVDWIQREWGQKSDVLYIPISRAFYMGARNRTFCTFHALDAQPNMVIKVKRK